VNARMSDVSDLPADSASDLVTGVMSTIAQRMAASGPERSQWEPSDGADTATLCSDPVAPGALLGEDPANLTVEAFSDSRQGVTTSGCRWIGADGASIRLLQLPSGAWAFDKIAASPGMIFHTWLKESTAFDVPGTDGALVVCIDECSALVSWRGSLVQLTLEDLTSDPASTAARVQAWSEALP
jgi:hypothetical protein